MIIRALDRLVRSARGLVLVAFPFALVPVQAQLATKGALLLEENFQRHAIYTKESLPLQAGWTIRVAHGRWERTAEGVRSIWEAGHSPVLVVEGSFGDVIVEVDYRHTEEPGKWVAYRLSAVNRALDPRAYAVSVWANATFDSRARGLILENDQWDGYITRVGRAPTKVPADTWNTLRLEIVGNRAEATFLGAKAKGSHEKFALPKTSLWLGTGLSHHELRNLRIYAALPLTPSPPAQP